MQSAFFYGYEKAEEFKIMMDKAGLHQSLKSVGTNQYKFSRAERKVSVHFVEALYRKAECDSINTLVARKPQKVTRNKLPHTVEIFFFFLLTCALCVITSS